jgi:hypothetical protein
MSCMVAILFFGTVYALEKIGTSTLFTPWTRSILADYAYAFGTIFWVGFCHIPGRLKEVHITKLPITGSFSPTQNRSWLIPFWELEAKWVFAAIPFGFLVMLLFYYDHVSCKHGWMRPMLIRRIERQQPNGAGQTVPTQEAWWIPLGLLPPGLYHVYCWNLGASSP